MDTAGAVKANRPTKTGLPHEQAAPRNIQIPALAQSRDLVYVWGSSLTGRMLVAFYAKLWYDEKEVIPGVARRVGEAPAPVVIGGNVWIGGGVIILPGVTIGNKDNNKSEVEER